MKKSAITRGAALLTALLIFPTAAYADTSYEISGRGYGHGIGMSQWGAYGFAKKGTGYRQILGHYYPGTEIGSSDSTKVRVLLKSGRSLTVNQVVKAGDLRLDPNARYKIRTKKQKIALKMIGSDKENELDSPLRLKGAGGKFVLRGRALNGVVSGSYRGTLSVVASGGGLKAVDTTGVENYVRGVVARESPSSWPQEALKTQAVAARSYALATKKEDGDFDLYPDTRSQVYGGLEAETEETNQAVKSTAHEIVTYLGKVATTFFFSTSGGRTENIEDAWSGSKPVPYLVSVEDPYEEGPHQSWGPLKFTQNELEDKLGGLVKGTLKDLTVTERGSSGRVVKATVVGSSGDTTTTGSKLQSLLGLKSTWLYINRSGDAEAGNGAVKAR